MSEQPKIKKWNLNTIYSDDIHPAMAFEALSEGGGIPSVCAKAGISKPTYFRWNETFPQFKEACEIGKAAGEQWWDKRAKEHLVITQEPGGPKVTFNEGLYRFTKKITYKAVEYDLSDSDSTTPVEQTAINIIRGVLDAGKKTNE